MIADGISTVRMVFIDDIWLQAAKQWTLLFGCGRKAGEDRPVDDVAGAKAALRPLPSPRTLDILFSAIPRSVIGPDSRDKKPLLLAALAMLSQPTDAGDGFRSAPWSSVG